MNRPLLRWHGGKWRLAPWILSHFPPHRVYTEVYGGAASVLLRKHRSYTEVYNDLDGDVVNLFRVLQKRDTAEALIDVLKLTPFARAEFDLAYEPTDDIVERARRLIIRSLMGFGSNGHNAGSRTGFRSNTSRLGTIPAHDWENYPNALRGIVERLRGVVIESRPAVDVLTQHDSPASLHYVDPPYVHSTRDEGVQRDYLFEMDDSAHRDLAGVLRSLSGMVILSGYPSRLYDVDLYPDWHRVERPSRADGGRVRIEVLWINDAAWRNREGLF